MSSAACLVLPLMPFRPLHKPGFIHTEMTAHLEEDQLKQAILLGRFGEPREVAQAVVFLLESPYVTGSILVVDGGLHLMT
ncbi:hypothetical protein AAES_142550 [Amazona aestiva]|uniref:3-ketoacyl-[acyl-carrier-protein] reductase beta subunit n=1 Tax=Amazona aestiva TaxID=12930 RepID=A0A0Q3UQP4_AMAAE|nr:hypothetical protein AAES_142550 [Amazona aestiva]